MRTAAFFDLDRTLLRGASGPVLSRALREVGVIGERAIPGEGVIYRLFDLLGETRPSIMLARQAARMARGWVQEEVRQAGEWAADRLADAVQPFARALLDEHRQAGRLVVLATTTPHDMIRPLADRLGFDDVVATHYGVAEGRDGQDVGAGDVARYDGTIAGEFVWGRGKLRAVQAWAAEHDVDLGDSWAYSDSFYDAPLLGAVGHPVAVNPDPRMIGVAVLRRWPITYLDVPDGVPKLPIVGIEPQKLLLSLVRPQLLPWLRLEVEGMEHIPEVGPAILVANHRSYFDPLALGMAFARRGRPVRFLGKREVFDAPVVGPVVRALGGIRVDRQSGSDEPLLAATKALAAGELVAILPQGTIPRGPEFFEPKLKGRWGAARLAELTKVPVIPVGLWGTEKVWPRCDRLPRMWQVFDPPQVTVRGGPPVELKYKSPKADTRRIMTAISSLLPPESQEPHDPTPEDLARTYPPGHRPGSVSDPGVP
jgi:putative phosphoserine phosphatase/1-acylglycerol-3-phosphate O-acyltransferase